MNEQLNTKFGLLYIFNMCLLLVYCFLALSSYNLFSFIDTFAFIKSLGRVIRR